MLNELHQRPIRRRSRSSTLRSPIRPTTSHRPTPTTRYTSLSTPSKRLSRSTTTRTTWLSTAAGQWISTSRLSCPSSTCWIPGREWVSPTVRSACSGWSASSSASIADGLLGSVLSPSAKGVDRRGALVYVYGGEAAVPYQSSFGMLTREVVSSNADVHTIQMSCVSSFLP